MDPEAGGPVEVGSPLHRALVTVLGAQSQREVLRARHWTLAAMHAQASGQGRYLGGRPPYGYRLVDAGPHPNQAHARWGRRLQRLDPDPATARRVTVVPTLALVADSDLELVTTSGRGKPMAPQTMRHHAGPAHSSR